MESAYRQIQKTNTRAKSSGEINSNNTAGIGMGRQRPSDLYKNTKWILRLEWRC
tara:strand:- start:116 stop:277 length:162 start_codon:yes stop_codon:yes gene_type:complete